MASEDQIAALRQMINEPDDTCEGYDDATLGAVIDGTLTLNAAAAQIWFLKAGQAATLVNVSESGSSRNLSDIMKNAQAMGKLYADLDAPEAADVSGPVIQRIRRTIA